ncbi:hypothetical protein B0H11DRAFT_1938050 [Mycena galericulata]|nr:hypothetical protein B0H11DRAFT_1938050 [Mycena galericulata]
MAASNHHPTYLSKVGGDTFETVLGALLQDHSYEDVEEWSLEWLRPFIHVCVKALTGGKRKREDELQAPTAVNTDSTETLPSLALNQFSSSPGQPQARSMKRACHEFDQHMSIDGPASETPTVNLIRSDNKLTLHTSADTISDLSFVLAFMDITDCAINPSSPVQEHTMPRRTPIQPNNPTATTVARKADKTANRQPLRKYVLKYSRISGLPANSAYSATNLRH